MNEYQMITLDVRDNIATVSLNRPDKYNAAPPALFDEIRDVIDQQKALGYRALVITGSGKAFCAGADLSGDDSESVASGLYVRKILRESYSPCLIALNECPVPVITAINGAAAGVGVGLALCGDFIFASSNAYFLQAFVNIGLVPDGGSSWFLPRIVGTQRAKELMLLGEKLTAEKAAEWGIVYRVTVAEDLLSESRELALRLAQGPTYALGLMRKMINDNANASLTHALNVEAQNQYLAANSEDATEGVAAFLGRRTAEFKGK